MSDKNYPISMRTDELDFRLIDVEGTLCVVVSGVTVDQIAFSAELQALIKDTAKRIVKANMDMGWRLESDLNNLDKMLELLDKVDL